jgi:hypothetical protein
MKYRKLRIAWSVGWGILCVLMIALWMRSRQHLDLVAVSATATKFIGASSESGQLRFYTGTWSSTTASRNILNHESFDANIGHPGPPITSESAWGFSYRDNNLYARLPHWFVALVTATMASAPWIRLSWRYSLRTLLVAMTLVAVGLGMIVYALR